MRRITLPRWYPGALGWAEFGHSYFNVCQQWVNNLYQAAEALAETARQYGYTDEEIAASFTGSAQSA